LKELHYKGVVVFPTICIAEYTYAELAYTCLAYLLFLNKNKAPGLEIKPGACI
jgi:hypothetical protein